MALYLIPLMVVAIVAGPEEVAVNDVVGGNNQFAADLLGKLRGGPGNVFASPYSISTALAMTYAGAKGETARQMASTLHFPNDGSSIHRGFGRPDRPGHGGPSRNLTSSTPRMPSGSSKGSNTGPSSPGPRSFIQGRPQAGRLPQRPEAARKAINDWVEKQTRDKIKDLLEPGVIKSSTDFVLTNAIYFKGTWARPFPKGATKDADFTNGDRKISIPTMHLTTTSTTSTAKGSRRSNSLTGAMPSRWSSCSRKRPTA